MSALAQVRRRTSATLDVDATILAAKKLAALRAYDGTRGYPSQMASWAEQVVWVCDPFRDGNVPAAFGVKDFLVRAFSNLPPDIEKKRLRADSALYDEPGPTWADEQGIEFAVSADMSEALALPDAMTGGPCCDPAAAGRSRGAPKPPPRRAAPCASAGSRGADDYGSTEHLARKPCGTTTTSHDETDPELVEPEESPPLSAHPAMLIIDRLLQGDPGAGRAAA